MGVQPEAAQEQPTQRSSQKRGKGPDSDLLDALSTAQEQSASLKDSLSQEHITLVNQSRLITRCIEKAKQELMGLPAYQADRVPEAGHELAQVLQATEEATNTIMQEAEAILELEASDLKSYQEAVNNSMMRIFEACSFQDITGQRIEKVVSTLDYIEERVAEIVGTLGIETEDSELQESTEQQRRDKQLLHGPASENDGIDQDDVDTLMSSDDIDALFD